MEEIAIIAALEGPDTSKAEEVTYALDGAQSERVLVALRRNLERECSDLVEITAMRLGVRFKDAASFQKLVELARAHPAELVIFAALKALSSIPERHDHLRSDAEATLQTLTQASSNPVLRAEAARQYLRLVGKITTREYASGDDDTILARYEAMTRTDAS